MTRRQVAIVGAGFAGLAAARQLAGKPVDVLLFNSENYHTFSPLLHHVATGAIAPANVLYSLRRGVRKADNIRFISQTITDIDIQQRLLRADRFSVAYDYLIVACGSQTYYGGVGVKEYAFSLKNIHDAVKLRNHVLTCFENEQIYKLRSSQLLTFCVVGAGATGVELAAELADWMRSSLARDYPAVDFRRVRIILLHRGDRILPELSAKSAEYARRQLQLMGVEIRLDSSVMKVTPDAVHIEDGRVIPTKTVIWTAGVRNHPIISRWGLTTRENQQLQVLPTLQHPQTENLYIIGDIAAPSRKLPMVASAAIAQGVTAGENILRQIKGRNPQPLKYKHPGTMVVLGRSAVAEIGKVRLTGLIAWILWMQVHWVYLPGLNNRIQVLINWIFSYILRDRPIKAIFAGNTVVKSSYSYGLVEKQQGREDELEVG